MSKLNFQENTLCIAYYAVGQRHFLSGVLRARALPRAVGDGMSVSRVWKFFVKMKPFRAVVTSRKLRQPTSLSLTICDDLNVF